MLDCELRPGVGLGPFQIGASLWTVLSNLREQKHIFPSVQVKYDPTPPPLPTTSSVPVGGATSIVLVHLYPHFDLLFSPIGQRLHTISLRRLRHGVLPSLAPASVPTPQHAGPGLCLRYKDHILSSPDITLRRSGVNKAFGPTYDWDSMKYPGVNFMFDEDPLTAVGMGTARAGEGDKNAKVKRVIVGEKFPDGHEADPFGEVEGGQITWGDISKAVIKVHQGVTLYFYPGESNALQVLLGTTTAQDLQVDLGPPIRVHYKEDDRMNIHATNQLESTTQDYFMNYFQHGLDFLIDGDVHTVKKILLHTNALGSPAFQRYKRCPWTIETTPEEEDQGQSHVSFYDHVDTISSFLDPSGEAPPSMNVDRADDDLLSLPSSYTRLRGFDGIILEATDIGVVSAVTLY